MSDAALSRLAEWLSEATRGVAFTGAGISTESGIPDFRSPGGLWDKQQPVPYQDFMADRGKRVQAWKMSAPMYRFCAQARPNDAHLAIAEFERRGHLARVITQNVDGLHLRAGTHRLIELHGFNRRVACQHCAQEWPTEEIVSRWERGDEAPECEHCGGPLKTMTISFGQAMPEAAMREAAQACREADFFVVLGSSLVVEPAASLPRLAKRSGARLVIVNREPTPLDAAADLVFRGSTGAVMRALARSLENPPSESFPRERA